MDVCLFVLVLLAVDELRQDLELYLDVENEVSTPISADKRPKASSFAQVGGRMVLGPACFFLDRRVSSESHV